MVDTGVMSSVKTVKVLIRDPALWCQTFSHYAGQLALLTHVDHMCSNELASIYRCVRPVSQLTTLYMHERPRHQKGYSR